LIEAFASHAALAIERANLAYAAQKALLTAETEHLRNALLSAVSHDLRTPLATIIGATSALLDTETTVNEESRRELCESAHEEAQRLSRLVGNLLDMTRLDAGALVVKKEWQPLDEVIGVAIQRLGRSFGNRPLRIDLPTDLPPVPLDDLLIEQVLVNLLENALKYTPADSLVELSARRSQGQVTVEVADRGPGLPKGEEMTIFDKFYRIDQASSGRGVGLGLAICRGIVELHGGKIVAENRPDGGVAFRFTLPLEGTPPVVPAANDSTAGEAMGTVAEPGLGAR
jgi:two-component system sensor histidine kinase KdpD